MCVHTQTDKPCKVCEIKAEINPIPFATTDFSIEGIGLNPINMKSVSTFYKHVDSNVKEKDGRYMIAFEMNSIDARTRTHFWKFVDISTRDTVFNNLRKGLCEFY